jgi:hypothetical protein
MTTDIQAQIERFSLEQAEGRDAEIIKRLYGTFREHNGRFFRCELPPAPILITLRVSPKAQADYADFSAFGCKHQIRIRPACARGQYPIGAYGVTPPPKPVWRMRPGHDLEVRFLWLGDLLLHEMAHLRMNQLGTPEQGYGGHGPAFAAECNRIGDALGWLPVVPKRRQGDGPSTLIASQWPFCTFAGGELACERYAGLWEMIGEKEAPRSPYQELCDAWIGAPDGDRRLFVKRNFLAVTIHVIGAFAEWKESNAPIPDHEDGPSEGW